MDTLGTIQIDYKKGETILRPEDTPQGVYYLKRGFVRSYSVSENGKETTLNIFKSTTYFPLQWVINNFNNEYFYEAMTKVRILRIPKKTFFKYISKKPKFLLDLTKRLINQIEILYMRMNHALGDNAYKRVISVLLFLAKRFGQNKNSKIYVSIPVTHLCIASIAGLTRETTSLTMKKIAEKNLISYNSKKIIILDVKKLENES